MKPDMSKVREAVIAIELARAARTPSHRSYPPKPSPVAEDAAIRKPLRAHGVKCSGFHHPAFLNRD